jgi:ribosomal protein S18 acetylase RimI-like enzyme
MTATYALNAYLNFPRIRRATAHDLPAIRELQVESLRAFGRRHYDGKLLDLFIEKGGMLDEVPAPEDTYWVAESGGRIVGACGFSERTPRYAAAIGAPVMGRSVRARIHGAFVHPDYARNGIGRCLMAGAEGAIRARGHRAVALDTTLCGVPLGVAMGYRDVARMNARLPGGHSLGLVHMRKELVRTARARAK